MKNILVLALIISATTAQSQSSSTSIAYNKNMQPALWLELPNTQDDVEATILKKLKETGYKPETEGRLFWKNNKIDGFYVFNNVVLPSLSEQKLDMYFKVVQKNKEEKNNSLLYLLVSTGNENFTSPERDALLWSNAKSFLDGFTDNTRAYSLEQDIDKQEKTLDNAQKELSTLRKDEKELSDKIRKLQDELRENQKSQADRQQNVEIQSRSLESLKEKRRG